MIMLSDVYMLYISLKMVKKKLFWVFIDYCKDKTLCINFSSWSIYVCLF